MIAAAFEETPETWADCDGILSKLLRVGNPSMTHEAILRMSS